jgi:GAF domain-containing protein
MSEQPARFNYLSRLLFLCNSFNTFRNHLSKFKPMSESSKSGRYDRVFEQVEKLLQATSNPVSRMATISALLHHKMKGFFWTGFYLLSEGELVVGPYQGPVACLKLKKDTGVCWAGINSGKSILVSDVEKFPGHIACSSLTKSEIVIPVINRQQEVVGVLDIDSRELDHFNETDRLHLEKLVGLIYL